jgi:B12-binding domain/radical SAM domain protein of rhizo-twelve system
MKVALVNPPWVFDHSVYRGCREAHLPLEFGYARQLLLQRRHDVLLCDAQLHGWDLRALVSEIAAYRPDVIVLTTAPSYLYWGCAPPELRVPLHTARALRPFTERLIVIGPHASTTPRSTLCKLGADVAILGECEEPLVRVVESDARGYERLTSIAFFESGSEGPRAGPSAVRVQGLPAASDVRTLPALGWQRRELLEHRHHHSRFNREPDGCAAELEASRGCPHSCSFCAKEHFRDRYRRRPLAIVLEEIDCLIHSGVRYLYFIDEIFLPDEDLLHALEQRKIEFGVQLRIDNWSIPMLELLGSAGCVSVEAGVESISTEGRNLLQKRARQSTAQLTERLLVAKRNIAFVQVNLLDTGDAPDTLAAWRANLSQHGVWSMPPAPLFPYPGSAEYRRRCGVLDDHAWERSHAHYLREYVGWKQVQERSPLALPELEGIPLDSAPPPLDERGSVAERVRQDFLV